MTWRAVVTALDDGDAFRSRISMYLHPLAGRPVIWHVLTALLEAEPAPAEVRVLHRTDTALALGDLSDVVRYVAVEPGHEREAVAAATAGDERVLLVDGAAALLTPASLGRLATRSSTKVLTAPRDGHALAVVARGREMSDAPDPWRMAAREAASLAAPEELLRVSDRHALAVAGTVIRDRLVRRHEAQGVSFILPSSVWIDVDVRIGPDTVIYPGVVLEGATVIGAECVIGPYSRLVDAAVGRGVELGGWNHLLRSTVRNHAVLEPYARRGIA